LTNNLEKLIFSLLQLIANRHATYERKKLALTQTLVYKCLLTLFLFAWYFFLYQRPSYFLLTFLLTIPFLCSLSLAQKTSIKGFSMLCSQTATLSLVRRREFTVYTCECMYDSLPWTFVSRPMSNNLCLAHAQNKRKRLGFSSSQTTNKCKQKVYYLLETSWGVGFPFLWLLLSR
jgi:hypothetical protein